MIENLTSPFRYDENVGLNEIVNKESLFIGSYLSIAKYDIVLFMRIKYIPYTIYHCITQRKVL